MEDAGNRRRLSAPGTTGLYHVAFVFPDRASLGQAVDRVLAAGMALDGADGTLAMVNRRLDVAALVAEGRAAK